jgi:hypothetical protein
MYRDLGSVFITGASTGIGYALAQRLDARGWRVFPAVRTDAREDADAARANREGAPCTRQRRQRYRQATCLQHAAGTRERSADRRADKLPMSPHRQLPHANEARPFPNRRLLARHPASSNRKRAIPRHASAIRKRETIRA